MNQRNLLAAAGFMPRSVQPPNAWVGHLPFAVWVIQEVGPTAFVELGTHTGNSYFAFCQAVQEEGLQTKCYAVDTWQGDEHAGRYGDEVFASVRAHNDEHYSHFSNLMRMTFDDAASYFSDGSIGLLHVDGLHTYEAVRHDFETWLPKLAPGAVVLFHDTNVRERGFGVWKLWEELQTVHPNIEFLHSHGLGVLQLNNAPEDKKLSWLRHQAPERASLIAYFSALGSRQLERYERDLQILALNEAVAERDRQVAERDRQVAERERQIEAIFQSKSWRITAPIRFIARKWRNRTAA